MTDAEPASSLISAQFQVIIGRQIRVIALTPFRCPFRYLAGETSMLKYNMSEMGRLQNALSGIGQSPVGAGAVKRSPPNGIPNPISGGFRYAPATLRPSAHQ